MSYNGWSNWATWNVALWIDNDSEWRYYFWKRAARVAIVDCGGSRDRAIKLIVGKLKYEHAPPDRPHTDLDPDDWKQVNWTEIATHLLDAELDDIGDKSGAQLRAELEGLPPQRDNQR
jgi:hypothetical protein